jgi:putative SOS response-associated peptidase YedK
MAMCGRFTHKFTWREIHDHLSGFGGSWNAPAEDPKPRYNQPPTDPAPIVIRHGDGLEGLMARWDFVPWFHTGPLEA